MKSRKAKSAKTNKLYKRMMIKVWTPSCMFLKIIKKLT